MPSALLSRRARALIFLPLYTIWTGIWIEGTHLFRMILNVTMEIGTTWPNLVVLWIQWGTYTTLSDNAAGEWIKKTCLWSLNLLSFCWLCWIVLQSWYWDPRVGFQSRVRLQGLFRVGKLNCLCKGIKKLGSWWQYVPLCCSRGTSYLPCSAVILVG